ncbi:DNA-directed RNA polymerase subunit beta [Frankliniella fusca]|uniref:DNA-directed RNA polymerase subunit beta n=1 Tax=Frankliniella fusca TaxID=407009 RepID=A0AAE1H7S1_9NEOP|nr:DNA-directed RNA polymerase subunit beta [Frankliniella fusca]
MLATSQRLHKPAEVGDTVTIPVPLVDRGKGGPRNVLAVVSDVTEDGFYRLANEHGTLKNLVSRNQFDVSKQKIKEVSQISTSPKGKRGLATAASLLGGQGFQRCHYKTRSGSDSETSGSSQGSSTLDSSKFDSETSTPIRGRTQLHFDHDYTKQSPFTLERLQQMYSQVILPRKTWSAIQYQDNKTAFVHHNANYESEKAVVFNSFLKPGVLFGKINYPSPPLIQSKLELEEFM